MKKCAYTFLFSLLVVVYIATSTGVCVYYHYCGGELEKVSAMVKAKSCCGNSDDTDGCCRNESKYIGLKSEFDMAKGQQPLLPSFTQLFTTPSFFDMQLRLQPQVLHIFHHDLHPADPVGMAIVRSTVFRI